MPKSRQRNGQRTADSSAMDGDGPVNRRLKNETMSVILTDLQIFDCYICCEPLTVPVFQCENGHISCSSCCTKVENKCPSCSLAIGFIRCRGIEKVLESIKRPCKNSKYGCKTTLHFNGTGDHESLCAYEPCCCPSPDCLYVGSVEQLCSHFTRQHNSSAKKFSYNSRFTMCLNPGDSFRVLQEEKCEALFLLSHSVELFGNAVTVNRIGPSASEKKFCYEIKAKTTGSNLCLQSVASEVQEQTELAPSKGSLLIPNDYFGSTQMILDFRIWPARSKETPEG